MKNKNSMYLPNMRNSNTPNQNKPLFTAKDHWVHISYYTENILSTNRTVKLYGHIKMHIYSKTENQQKKIVKGSLKPIQSMRSDYH